MSTTADPREVTFQTVRLALREKAPLMHNVWALVGRGEPRAIEELARVLWYPDAPPQKRQVQQMRVGAFVAHLNKRVREHGVIIRPGAIKGTYQLYNSATWEQEQAAMRATAIHDAGGSPPLVTRRPRKNAP